MTTMTTKFLFAAFCNVVLLTAMADASSNGIRRSNAFKVDDLAKMDKQALLRNAIKIDKRLHHRFLDDAEGNAEEEGEENNAEEEDNREEEQNDVEQEEDQNEGDQDEGDQEEPDDAEEDVEEEADQDAGDEEEAVEEDQDEAQGEQDAAEEEQEPVLQLAFLKCGA
jgi:hypothetical protein